MREWTRLLVSLCCRQGVRSGSLTQYRFASIIHQWCHVILTQTAIMTCDTERHQCHRRLLQACPLCNFDKGTKCHNGIPLPLLWAACTQAADPVSPTLAPPTTPTPPLWGSTNCPCFTIFILSYWLLILFVVTVVFFPNFTPHLWHLSLFVPFHKLVQQNWP